MASVPLGTAAALLAGQAQLLPRCGLDCQLPVHLMHASVRVLVFAHARAGAALHPPASVAQWLPPHPLSSPAQHPHATRTHDPARALERSGSPAPQMHSDSASGWHPRTAPVAHGDTATWPSPCLSRAPLPLHLYLPPFPPRPLVPDPIPASSPRSSPRLRVPSLPLAPLPPFQQAQPASSAAASHQPTATHGCPHRPTLLAHRNGCRRSWPWHSGADAAPPPP